VAHVFADNKGRRWTVEVNVGTIRRVKALLGVNLLEAVTGELANRMGEDPALFGDVLFACIKPQADAAGVTDSEFGEGLSGDATEEASLAFLQAVVDFFPKGRREMLGRALTAGVEQARKREMEAIEKLKALESSSGRSGDSQD
jgi:hypothetical protein